MRQKQQSLEEEQNKSDTWIQYTEWNLKGKPAPSNFVDERKVKEALI